MKTSYWFVIITVTLLITIAIGVYWVSTQMLPVSTEPRKVSFIILPNEPASSVIGKLESNKLIRSTLVAKLYLQSQSLDQALRPGSYILSPSQNLVDIFNVLSQGPKDIWVTIPEGWRREQVAARFSSLLSGPSSQFDEEEFLKLTANLEGQLFPDSYLIPLEMTAPQAVNLLTSTFSKKTNLVLPQDNKTLILASLLEREARNTNELPIIAGILLKRLESGWPLQIDATVQYAVNSAPNWWAPITNTRHPSPYNTYLSTGLPPGPISSPGLAAIKAVQSPKASSYWYYIHDSQGQAHFASTLVQHQANIDKYLRL